MFSTIWNFIGAHLMDGAKMAAGGAAWHGILYLFGKVKPLFKTVEAEVVSLKKKL